MNIKTQVLFALLLAVIAPASANVFTDFFTEVTGGGSEEAAPYQVIKVHNPDDPARKYEERLYPARKWVCSDSVMTPGAGNRNGKFMTLFRYITGANARDESIPMTVPVTMHYTPAEGGKERMAMCFYLGAPHQANPPQPTNADVYLQDRPAMTIYTRTFGGWPGDAEYKTEKSELSNILAADGNAILPYDEYRVGYQSPMRLFNRRNELWLVKA